METKARKAARPQERLMLGTGCCEEPIQCSLPISWLFLSESTSFFPHPVGCSLCSRLLAEDSFTRVPEHSCYMSGYLKTISLISVDLDSKSQGCSSDWFSWGKMVPKVGLSWWSWGTGSHCTGWLLGRSSVAFDSETCSSDLEGYPKRCSLPFGRI